MAYRGISVVGGLATASTIDIYGLTVDGYLHVTGINDPYKFYVENSFGTPYLAVDTITGITGVYSLQPLGSGVIGSVGSYFTSGYINDLHTSSIDATGDVLIRSNGSTSKFSITDVVATTILNVNTVSGITTLNNISNGATFNALRLTNTGAGANTNVSLSMVAASTTGTITMSSTGFTCDQLLTLSGSSALTYNGLTVTNAGVGGSSITFKANAGASTGALSFQASPQAFLFAGSLLANGSYGLGSSGTKWATLYSQNITDDGTSSTLTNDVTMVKSGTGVTETLTIQAGAGGTASTSNVAKSDLVIRGGGGGDVTATVKHHYNASIGYVLNLAATNGITTSAGLYPDTTATYALGSSSFKWSSLHTAGITDTGSAITLATPVTMTGSSGSTITNLTLSNTGTGSSQLSFSSNNGTNTCTLTLGTGAGFALNINKTLTGNGTNTYDLGTSSVTWRNTYSHNFFGGVAAQYVNLGVQGANNTPQLYWTNSAAADKALYMRESAGTNDRILDVYITRTNTITPQDGAAIYCAVDNTYSFGASGARWKDIWAGNAVIQTSDLNKKTDIAPSQLGLSFINSLTPKQFKFIDGTSGRLHYGFIAQEVETLIAGLLPNGTQDFAGLVKDTYQKKDYDPLTGETITSGDPVINYGLRYDELIGPMVKAIQELTARIVALES